MTPVAPEPPEEAPVTDDLQDARDRWAKQPATHKACMERGYKFLEEWFRDGAFYCLAWDGDHPVRLRLDPATWQVTEEATL